jgi:hypothetical protein
MSTPKADNTSARWRLDAGLALAALIGLLAAWPFLTRPGLPTLTDAQHHVYRTFELIAAWRQGVPYLRWAPDFFYGFGYPVFNYYAPLTYFLAGAYGALWGPVAGVKFVFVLSAVIGPAGLYLFVRDRWSPAAGVVAAAAFALAPYVAYMDPQARGAAPEALALALAPWMLWTFARLQRTGQARDLALAALTLAALLLAHNLLSLVVMAMTIAWLVWEALWAAPQSPAPAPRQWPRRLRLSGLALATGAMALAVCLAAFFWLPAFLERGDVQFQNAFRSAYGFRFVGLGELLSPARLADLATPDLHFFRFPLGLPQWILAALGVLAALFWPARREQRSAALFFAAVAAGSIGLMLPIAAPLWTSVPGLAYLQFPWRLLGPAALALAILAGAAVHGLIQLASAKGWRVGQTALASLAVAACVAAALPILDPLPWPASPPVTVHQMITLEQSGAWGVGTTHDNEFLPVTVRSVPKAQPDLLASYDAGQPDKVDRASLPPGATVTLTAHRALEDDFQVSSEQDFALRLWTFDFPGWTAWVDGQPAAISATQPNGFLSVAVPAGAHAVTVQWQDTPAERQGWIISAFAVLAWFAALAWSQRQRPALEARSALTARPALALAAVIIAGLGARYALDTVSPWRAGSTGNAAPIGALADNIVLFAVKLPQDAAHAGDQVPLTLNWQATGPVPADLSSFVHLIGPDGQLWGQADKYVPVPFFPTGRWPVGRLMSDDELLAISPSAPPGQYQLVAGLWDRDTGRVSTPLNTGATLTAPDGIVISNAFQIR